MNTPLVPVIQIRPNCLLRYYSSLGLRKSKDGTWREYSYRNHNSNSVSDLFARDPDGKEFDIVKDNGKVRGTLSRASVSRLKRAINLLLAISPQRTIFNPVTSEYQPFRINFITLTLPAPQLSRSDREIKNKCLSHFLRTIQRKHNCHSYVWKAEKQANGNLHFHLTTNTFIHYAQIREYWNKSLELLELVSDYHERQLDYFKNGFRVRKELLKSWNVCNQLKSYVSGLKYNWWNPNSTDVHSVKSVRNLAAYVATYMAKKEEGKELVDGKIWDCSKNLKTKHSAYIHASNEDNNHFDRLAQFQELNSWSNEFVELIYISEKDLRDVLPHHWEIQYDKWLNEVKSGSVVMLK